MGFVIAAIPLALIIGLLVLLLRVMEERDRARREIARRDVLERLKADGFFDASSRLWQERKTHD